MSSEKLDGILFTQMILMGASKLNAHAQEINNLNVFPIPDGDTGDNMLLTMMGGTKTVKAEEPNLGVAAQKISSGMLLGARGNSGVILSQFFDGIAKGFEGLEAADVLQVGKAFQNGVKHAYEAVVTPTEGTILTVAKDATNFACESNAETVLEFIENFIKEAKLSLDRTPSLLPVLKKAGVVDSGGAGLVYIMEGLKEGVLGNTEDVNNFMAEKLHETSSLAGNQKPDLDLSKFTEDSVLEFGYCTELLLRLQNSKCNPKDFNVDVIKEFLNPIGNSIVVFKTESIVKLHVHTMTPDKVLAFCQQFGEFLTIKIENMSLQHNNLGEDSDLKDVEAPLPPPKERKPFSVVAVAAGEGIQQMFLDNGADYIVNGGQSMNPSSEDFIQAFDTVNADTIFVLPNNGNVILSAKQAAGMYKKSEVRVIESKSIGDGYAALTMMDTTTGKPDDIEESMNFAMDGVSTYQISLCVRDAEMDGVKLHNGDYIGFCGKEILASSTERKDVALKTVDKMDFTDHEVCILIRGADSSSAERDEIKKYIEEKHPGTEIYTINGKQDIYSYILIVE
ncbi:MAG: DAK2 domain-containing protein [Treponema sp.]|nr:DAK2 domain-containing protein [Treponema sp.]